LEELCGQAITLYSFWWKFVFLMLYDLPNIYITTFLFFTIANISFPGTSSFVGEFLILLGSFKVNTTITFFSATGGAAWCLLFRIMAYQS
jgi:NADH:ubiquinone oxidoreductase subunit 4 (subunit M)